MQLLSGTFPAIPDKLYNFEQNGENKYVHKHASDVMKCPCLYSCRSLIYQPTITTAHMNNLKMDPNNSFIDLDVYFQKEFITMFLTTVSQTLTDLMGKLTTRSKFFCSIILFFELFMAASFGGLAGLCIGCSLLSLVEIAYFLLIKIPHKTLFYLEMRKRSRDVRVHTMQN